MREMLKKLKRIYINIGIPKLIFDLSKIRARKRYNLLKGKKNITILSPNCIAGEIYNILGLQFNSPLINSSMKRVDFIEFCLNLELYLQVTPTITGKKNGHPILTLEGKNLKRIDIAFVHDYNDEEVLKNWEKRKKRIQKNNIFIIMDNKDEKGNTLSDKIVNRINSFKCTKKVIFVSSKVNIKNSYLITKKQIKKYNYKKLSGLYGFQYFFNYVDFLAID